MINLQQELLKHIKESGYEVGQIIQITDGFRRYTLDDLDFEYYNGYGSVEVHSGLCVLLDDGAWLERAEYDGSEWFVLRRAPKPNYDLPWGTKSDLHEKV